MPCNRWFRPVAVSIIAILVLSVRAPGAPQGIIEVCLSENPLDVGVFEGLSLGPGQRELIEEAWLGYQRRLTELEQTVGPAIRAMIPEDDDEVETPQEFAEIVRRVQRTRVAARQPAQDALEVLLIGIQAALDTGFADQFPRIRRAVRRASVFADQQGIRRQDFGTIPDAVAFLDKAIDPVRGRLDDDTWLQVLTMRDGLAIVIDRQIPSWWYARQDRLQELRILRDTARPTRYMSVRRDGRRIKHAMYNTQFYTVDAIGQLLFAAGEHRTAHDLYSDFFTGWLPDMVSNEATPGLLDLLEDEHYLEDPALRAQFDEIARPYRKYRIMCLKTAARYHWDFHFDDPAPIITTGPGFSSAQCAQQQLNRAVASVQVREQILALPLPEQTRADLTQYLQRNLTPVSPGARWTLDHPDGVALIRQFVDANRPR